MAVVVNSSGFTVYKLGNDKHLKAVVCEIAVVYDASLNCAEHCSVGVDRIGVNGAIPFKDQFPTNTELYKLMTTKFGE